jgi:ATP-binding cassette subfamily F protein 3
VVENLSAALEPGTITAILGPNGAGKSSLLLGFAGLLGPSAGRVTLADRDLADLSPRERARAIGYLPQAPEIAWDVTVESLIALGRLPWGDQGAEAIDAAIAALALDNMRDRPASRLSGGERARLLLNMVAMRAPHMLILDEPTNHLDIDSRRALLDALNDYEGAVILITHDRSLMEMVADRLWLAADGSVKPFNGDMDDYAKFVLDRARVAARAPTQVRDEPAAKASTPAAPAAKPANRDAQGLIAPLQRKMESAEQALARCTKSLATLDSQLADPAFAAKAEDLMRQRARAQDQLDVAEARWMEAAETFEKAKLAAGL